MEKKDKTGIIISIFLGILVAVIIALGVKVLVFDKKDDGKAKKKVENKTKTTKEPEISTDVSLVFGGDFLLNDDMINAYNKNDGKLSNLMSDELKQVFIDADIAMVNNEFPFSTRGVKADKQYTFRCDPKYASVLNDMGVDIVSLANNHALDFGRDALSDTFEALKNVNVVYGGAGNNIDEAKEIKYLEKNSKKFAFICASRVIPVSDWTATSTKSGMFTTYDGTMMCDQIKEAKENADIAIAFVHWGIERAEYPENYQRTLAKQYIDAGADLVIGAHTHCLQGMEVYKGKLITYSLGNFIFNGRYNRTMYLKVIVDKDNKIKAQFVPCEASSYKTAISEGEKGDTIREYYKGISYGVVFDESGNIDIEGSQDSNDNPSVTLNNGKSGTVTKSTQAPTAPKQTVASTMKPVVEPTEKPTEKPTATANTTTVKPTITPSNIPVASNNP